MSIISEEMIVAFAAKHNTSLADGSQRDGIYGSLAAWEAGRGEFSEELGAMAVFAPLYAVYLAEKSKAEPTAE